MTHQEPKSKPKRAANKRSSGGRCASPCSAFIFQFQDCGFGWQGGKFHDDDEQSERSKKSLEGAKKWARSFIKKNGGCLPIGGKVRIVEIRTTVAMQSRWDSFPTNATAQTPPDSGTKNHE